MLGYAFLVEPHWLDVTRHDLGGAPGAPRVRIAQLSDVHLGTIGAATRIALEALHAAGPDLLLLTGDIVDSPDDLPAFEAFLAALPRVPTFAVPGNWEHRSGLGLDTLRAACRRHGVRLLVDEAVAVETPAGTVGIFGMDDSLRGRPDLRRLAGFGGDGLNLVLQHSPGVRDASGQAIGVLRGTTLMLAGHTHGGQLALFGWAPYTPPGSGRYVAGWYRDGPLPLYVNRGAGTSYVHARLGARPELAVFEWRGSGTGSR